MVAPSEPGFKIEIWEILTWARLGYTWLYMISEEKIHDVLLNRGLGLQQFTIVIDFNFQGLKLSLIYNLVSWVVL